MADREKLIEIIAPVLRCLPWGQVSSHTAEDIADRLIENAVIVPKWTPVTEGLPEMERVKWEDLEFDESRQVLGFGRDGYAVVKCSRELGAQEILWIDTDGNVWPVDRWTELPRGE